MHKRRRILITAVGLAALGVVLLARELLVSADHARKERFTQEFRAALRRTPRAKHEQLFTTYLDRFDANGLLDILEDEFSLCHSQAHPLGMAVFAQTRDVNLAIAACANRCTGGCFHGVLMAAFQDFVDVDADDPEDHVEFDEVIAHAKTICDDPATTSVHRRGNCAHGIGHALTFLTGYRIADALEACRLFDEKPLQYYCSSGAYMERDIVYGFADAKSPSLFAPCDQPTEFPAACYRYKVKKYFASPGRSLNDVAEICLGLEHWQRLGCFHGLGFANLNTVARQQSTLGDVCRFGDLDDQKICIEGAIEKLADYGPRRAKAACTTLPPDLEAHCRQAVDYGLYSLEKPFTLYFADP